MPKTVVVIEFDGTDHLGWQIQKDFSPTIQEQFNKALFKIFKKEISTMASGRTDSGVHSLDMHISFIAPFVIPLINLVKALNAHLPSNIRALRGYEVDDKWHATVSASSREYMYLFSNNESENAFQGRYIPNISFDLNVDLMRRACLLFVGEHDFVNFFCTGTDVTSTVRAITKCEIEFHQVNMHGLFPDHYSIKIEGSGFLKQMVRLIVGAIWSVGRQKLELDDLKIAIEARSKGKVAAVAPAQGLFKIGVQY